MTYSREMYDVFLDFFDHSDWIDFIDSNWPELILDGTFPEELKSKILIGFVEETELMDGATLLQHMQALGIPCKVYGNLFTGFMSITQADFNLLKLSTDVNTDNGYPVEYYSMDAFYKHLDKRHLVK